MLTAPNGGEALAIVDARAEQIDLAVLDVVMPQLGGEAVLRHLRKRRPGIPVVFASGYGWSAHSGDLARTALLQKPYTREQLLQKVREMLDIARVPLSSSVETNSSRAE